MPYKIKNLKIASQGRKNIDWARMQMGALLEIKKRFQKEKPLKGIIVGLSLHVTKETAILVETLLAGGAKVAISSCNPLSTQDDVAAALAKRGVSVFAWKGETVKDYYQNIDRVINFLKTNIKGKNLITIDDGCDLVSRIHLKYPDLIKNIICGCEETTTGVLRLRAMEKSGALKYPIIAVNDNQTKHLFDNYYGTGQSTWDGILRASNILVAGKTAVIVGYGNCGKGVALRARGLGAKVVIVEVDPLKALQAIYDGYQVLPIKEAAKIGDIFITVTGQKRVIQAKHFQLMKDGAILANAGHFDHEIDVQALEKMAIKKIRIRPYFDEYQIKQKKIYLVGEGRLVNLVCAEGHPSVVMAMSFAGQALAVEYGVKNKNHLPIKVITLPLEIDQKIAQLQLKALGVKIDQLTLEQKKYLKSWREGT